MNDYDYYTIIYNLVVMKYYIFLDPVTIFIEYQIEVEVETGPLMT